MTRLQIDFPLASLDALGAKRINLYTVEVSGRYGRVASIVARGDTDPAPSRYLVNVFAPVQRHGQPARGLESYGNFRTLAGVVAYLIDQDLRTIEEARKWKPTTATK